eukprot:TRINITY_DN75127_c0_g1_i1.p1 TRINITY_DN75127_c0_g1~~TRINITY_DN75127_c0_g1_i1.p1  ORF type:complete len:1053 (+),score=125.84 TRINITY_DN75127_c0_g1_i1:30-3188(+)
MKLFNKATELKMDKFERTKPPPDWHKNSIKFHMIELDADHHGRPRRDLVPPEIVTPERGEVTVIRMFGVTKEGHSVLVHAHGFSPYFWIQSPKNFDLTHCRSFKDECNKQLANRGGSRPGIDPIIHMGIDHGRSLQNFQFHTTKDFIRVTCHQPFYVPKVRSFFDQGAMYPALWSGSYHFTTYESNVPFELRFMIDNNLSGSPWVEIPAGKFKVVKPTTTHAQIEVEICYRDLVALPSEGIYNTIAPFRILSFDLECQGEKGQFPNAKKDPIIQISNYVFEQGSQEPLTKNVFTLNTCSNIVGADVFSFANEADMLMAWRYFLTAVDPDILTGYNIINFDMPYLLDRAETLDLKQFPFWGRLVNDKTKMKDAHFQSAQTGQRDYKEITIAGRCQIDVMVSIQRDHKLRSYSLNAVSAKFLGEQKEDVAHNIISDLQMGDADTRRRLAVYCLKDAYLPMKLANKLMIIVNLIEMARVSGVAINFLMTRGQQIKVMSQILRKGRVKGLLFPFVQSDGSEGGSYEGATVIEPTRGFHNYPVATLDFASLYPSIMMAHNLCYSTLVPKGHDGKPVIPAGKELPEDAMERTPSGDYFVKKEHYKGILPEILEELLAARKQAKKLMAAATDPMEHAVFNGRQLALKVTANSVYGFTGATVGKLPCLEISRSVTAFGRTMINQTKQMVEEKYNKANGYEYDAKVIYGDTDSVMVNFGYPTIEESMKLGKEAAGYVSQSFIAPIRLEFEKVYCPYLLMSKKRYAGLLHTKPDKYDYLDAKGIESVRRDNCPLVKNLVQTVLNKILIDRSVPAAIEYVKKVISDLLMNRMDISNLVISKSMSKSGEEYHAKQAHVELVERMRKRDPTVSIGVGDRIPYVIIKGPKGAKAFEKSEDPIYVLENNIPIDTQHYLEHQLAQPLERLFEALLDNPKAELLQGAHTRKVAVATPTKAVGGMMKFAQVKLTCLHCKGAITSASDSKATCESCADKEPMLYAKTLSKRNYYERQFSRVWTQCQRCQGSLQQEVLCTSRDCPVFYMRKKVQKDLKEQQQVLDRFGSIEW